MGGNGAAMRTSFIGLHYYKKEQLAELITKSLDASRLTHNHPLGFMGGLTTALFCSYAIRNIEPWKWGEKLLKLDSSGIIETYMEHYGLKEKYIQDKYQFWDPWYRYVEERLPRFYLKPKEFTFSSDRIADMITYTPGIVLKNKKADFSKFGSTGCGATLIAYDSLLNSFNIKRKINSLDELKIEDIHYSWETLLYFSTLHFGDNDSTGIIAGSWYGALFGFHGFKKESIEQLEFKDEILKDL